MTPVARCSWLLLLISVAAGLAGCATTPEVTGAGATAAELDAWEATGRLGVAAGERGGSGSFLWQQAGDQSLIRIRGPVGIGGIEVELDDADLRVLTSDGQYFESEAAEREIAARLGASVPAGNLRYWLLGLPAPGAHRWLDGPDGARVLEQDGWRIEYGE
ncbi:MAG TPA: lipoprotein insertase outer membrane protein LolB, partial [Steroidobacteraceae bacterium]|nr:lipoprotein insertase outer membrane protein LolB [Steroidobacteraceae bacterium]